MMKKNVIVIIAVCFAQILSAQPVRFHKQLKLPVQTKLGICFDAAFPQLITCRKDPFDLRVFVEDIEQNKCDSLILEVPGILSKKETAVDLRIISPDSFYLLTNERLLKIFHTGNTFEIVNAERLPKNRHYRNIHLNEGQLFLSSFFTPDAKRTPKINIWNKSKDLHYSYFAACDPHAICSGYNLIALNKNNIFCVVKDNVNPDLTFITDSLREMVTVPIFSTQAPDHIKTRACEWDRKYNAHGDWRTFDSLLHYLRILTTIEKVFFLDTNKVFVVGVEHGKEEDLGIFMQVITFDSEWKITGRENVRALPSQDEMNERFSTEKICPNVYGKQVKENNGMIIFRDKCVTLDAFEKIRDYNSAYNAMNNRDCYYIFNAR